MLASKTSRLYQSLMEKERIDKEAHYDKQKKDAKKLIDQCKQQLARARYNGHRN